LRSLWREELGRTDAERLVCIDEMGTHTSLAPLYAYSPVGQRAFFEIARNRAKNTTLLTSLHGGGMGPSMAVEGVTTARVFETCTERLLAPALRPGQIVVMDDLGAHRPRKIKELIEEQGCELLYLPSYSPDLNPIEEALSKVKHIPRTMSPRLVSVALAGASLGALVRGCSCVLGHLGLEDLLHRPFDGLTQEARIVQQEDLLHQLRVHLAMFCGIVTPFPIG
jgi:hypothetical protein